MNPLLQKLSTQQANPFQNIAQIKKTWDLINSMGNPQEAINQIMASNPKVREINKLIEEAGGDPEKAFRMKAQEMGVNPDDFINAMK